MVLRYWAITLTIGFSFCLMLVSPWFIFMPIAASRDWLDETLVKYQNQVQDFIAKEQGMKETVAL